ncbi:DUF3180 domain-containing protein [Leifsonia sp. Le1]|uniref:DUF3180 domain-containing protein n=1 Tax=Leifsonia sp. Le1 TaxID=3404918 RepID=UPI003EB91E10
MKRTTPVPLIVLGVVAAVAGFLIELALAGSGLAVFVPPLTLPITLVAVSIIVVAFAVPIRRAVRGRNARPIDPFQAMRIVVLAKACSLSGALLTGLGAGLLVYLLSRAVIPAGGTIWLTVSTTVGAIVLLIAGLVAEYLCTIPPDDKNGDPENVHVESS